MIEKSIQIACDAFSFSVAEIQQSHRKVHGYETALNAVVRLIEEKGGYNYLEWSIWIHDEIKNYGLYVGLYIKRIFYMIHDFEIHGTFYTPYFCLKSYKYEYDMLDGQNSRILGNYLIFKKFSFHTSAMNSIAHFLFYLQGRDIRLHDITMKSTYEYYKSVSETSTWIAINDLTGSVNSFLSYCFENNLVESKCATLICHKLYARQYEAIVQEALLHKNEFEEAGANGIVINTNDISKFSAFKALFIEMGYVNKAKSVEVYLNYLFMFLEYTSLPLTSELVFLWAEKIIKMNLKHSFDYKNTALKYYDYIVKGCVDFDRYYVEKNKYEQLIPSWARNFTDRYLEYRKRNQMKYNTLTMDRNCILRFSLFLDNKNINDFKLVSADLLIEYYQNDEHKTNEGRNAYMSRIRGFLKFLRNEEVIDIVFDSVVIGRARIPKKTVEVISNENVQKIEDSREMFKDNIELRDYAIYMLGVKTGLRSTDIVNLKLNDISFKNRTISVFESKTQSAIILPLHVDTANAIYRYLRDGRSETDSPYLFVKVKRPFNKLSRHACIYAINSISEKLDIEKMHGFHITRRTYASNIMKNTHDIPKTATLLGHEGNANVHKYLNIDDEMMNMCPLALSVIPLGGAWHD